MKKNKLMYLLTACMLAACLQVGCGGASKDGAVAEEYAAEAPMAEEYYADDAIGMVTSGSSEMKEMLNEGAAEEALEEGSQAEVTTERKLIKTVNLTLETENYDAIIEGLEQEIARLGGYIEYKDAYHGDYKNRKNGYNNRHANITARIPADKLEVLVDKKVWPFPTYADLIFEV